MAFTPLVFATKMAEADTGKAVQTGTTLAYLESVSQPVLTINVANHTYEVGDLVRGITATFQSTQSIYTMKTELPAGEIVGVSRWGPLTTSATVALLVYDDSAGPNNLLKQENGFTGTVNDTWVRYYYTTPLIVSAGTYHVGFFNSGTSVFETDWDFSSIPTGIFNFMTGLTYPTAPDPATGVGTNTNRPAYVTLFRGPVVGELYIGSEYLSGLARVIYLHGELSGDVILTFPWRWGVWQVVNNTTGAFNVYARYIRNLTVGRPGGGVQIAQGDGAWIYGNGEDIYFVDPTKGVKV